MARHSFVQMNKLTNVCGRVDYISNPKRQEHLYATYATVKPEFWKLLADQAQFDFWRSNQKEGKCIEARELIIALPESFQRIEPETLLKIFAEKFRIEYGMQCTAALHHNRTKTNYHIHLVFADREPLKEKEDEKLRQCNRRLYAMQDRQETHQKALDTLPRTVFHYKERKELQADLEDLQKKMAKKNLIECCRILFTLIVCLHHAASLSDKPLMLKHGYLCVEFFFMLSGYLLHRSFRREELHSTLHYVGKRLRRLYPEYAFAAIIAILLYGVLRREFDLTQAVQELLMLQNTGLFRMGGYNYPCWYIAVMMVSGILIYGMLTVSRQTYVKVLAPLVILGGYTYLIGLRDGIEEWSYAGPVSQALLRGFCGMSVGVLISCFVCRKIKISRKLILLMEIVSVLLMAAGLFTDISSEMLTITAFGGLLLAISLDEAGQAKLAESRLIPAVSGYCYGMYLNHAVVITVMGLLKGRVSFSVLCIIFYAVLFMYTAVTRRVSRGAAKALESWFGSDS